jgi:hypothetical protein
MRPGLIELFKRAFRLDAKLHPIDRSVARRWIKMRLAAVFPELRGNPHALEAAYRSLDMEARVETNGRTWTPVFEINAPGE